MDNRISDSDLSFMHQALTLAEKALAGGEFPVGCIFVHNGEIVAKGERHGSGGTVANEIDHAEMMALGDYYRHPAPPDAREITAYCTLEPCLMCFSALVVAGVGKIVFAYEDAMGGGSQCPLSQISPYYENRAPEIVPYVLREESLALFQKFFRNPETRYLKGTLLAEYTLSQPSNF